MEISVDILQKFYEVKNGQIYGGKIFAKDGSPHKAVIFYVSEDAKWVYSFCITSKEKTVRYFSMIDSKDSVVSLPKDLILKLFGNEENSWVYCGISNLSKVVLSDFYKKLSEKEISYYEETLKELGILKKVKK